MINRALIRLKIVQVVYAYYLSGGKTIDTAVKELFFSLQKAYDLYLYLLLLIVDITRYAERRQEVARHKHLATPEERNPNTRFVENRFAAQLSANLNLKDFVERQKKTWDNEPEIVKILFDKIVASDTYKDYMAAEASSYDADRELWRKIYKQIICNNDDLDECLEGQSLYWNDDKEVVDTFVLKTIKRFDPANGKAQELLPAFSDSQTEEYARTLFYSALQNRDAYMELLTPSIDNWEVDRFALMDTIIMQIAVAELMNFPNIPISVTLNEFVEIAKRYSTAKSGAFVNGVLDKVAHKLIQEQKILKN